MSAILMLKKCKKCGKKYSYNPSVGNFGMICPYCGNINGFFGDKRIKGEK